MRLLQEAGRYLRIKDSRVPEGDSAQVERIKDLFNKIDALIELQGHDVDYDGRIAREIAKPYETGCCCLSRLQKEQFLIVYKGGLERLQIQADGSAVVYNTNFKKERPASDDEISSYIETVDAVYTHPKIKEEYSFFRSLIIQGAGLGLPALSVGVEGVEKNLFISSSRDYGYISVSLEDEPVLESLRIYNGFSCLAVRGGTKVALMIPREEKASRYQKYLDAVRV